MDSTTSNKRIARNTVMLYVRMLLLMLVTLYTSRVVLRELGVEDFGLYSIVGSVVIFLGFINNSMTGATQRFLSYYQGKGDKEELNVVFNSVFASQAIISLTIFVAGETLGLLYISNYLNIDPSKTGAAHIVYQFSLLSFVYKTLTVPYTSAIISNEKMGAFTIISIAEVLLQLAVVLSLKFIPSNKLIAYSALLFVTVIITQSLYQIYCKRHFEECEIKRNWEKKHIKDIFSFSGWNLLGSLAQVTVSQGTNIILNAFFGVVVNAAKGIAAQVSGATTALSGNFQKALNPQIIKRYSSGQFESMHKLVIKGTKLGFYLLLIVFVPIFFNMEQVLTIWLTTVPEYSVGFCKLIIIYTLISVLSNSLMTSALATGKIRRYEIIISLINFCNIPLSLIALYIYPNPLVTMVVTIVVGIAVFIGRLVLTSNLIRLSKMKFFTNAILPILLTTVTTMIICHFANMECAPDEYGKLILNISMLFAITAICISLIGLSKSEKMFALNIIKKRLR